MMGPDLPLPFLRSLIRVVLMSRMFVSGYRPQQDELVLLKHDFSIEVQRDGDSGNAAAEDKADRIYEHNGL